MDRLHESLDYRASYDDTTQLLNTSLITIEKHCRELRDRIEEQRKLLTDSLRLKNDDPKNIKAIQATLNFHDHIRLELVEIEQNCHEYRAKIGTEIASEILQNFVQPLHVSFEAVKKAYDLCCRSVVNSNVNEEQSMLEKCLCQWTNVSPYILENTQNIVFGYKRSMPSEFDDSDEKFKQDMMILRTEAFSVFSKRNKESLTENKSLGIGRASKKEFIETIKRTESFALPSLQIELNKVGSLKFVDGQFKTSDAWARLLDIYGQQVSSKWCLIIRPQIEKLLRKHRITIIHLSSSASLDFLTKIPENGINCRISREDIIPLVEGTTEMQWLKGTRMQIRDIDGKDVAATLIQTCWRGYQVRRRIFNAECRYTAASIIWVSWLVLKKKRRMHERYLRNMLTSLEATRELCRNFSIDYARIISNEHTIIHVPSLGLPLDLRREIGSSQLPIYQNTMALKFSSLRNPCARVIYVLPIKETTDLLMMYRDIIDAILPNENSMDRMSFVELSEADTFADCSFNVARTLHCSEETLITIKEKIGNKSAFFLPWIMDECDVRLAGKLSLPILGPDMEIQRHLLNRSNMCEIIDELNLDQPAHEIGIKDYTTLCSNLAGLICENTEICRWLIKLNIGLSCMHTGVFLINHISIPFMPILRKERGAHGDEWTINTEIRKNFLKCLSEHLPGVVYRVTRLSNVYAEWKDFYARIVKYGCVIQAVPNEKSSIYVCVSLFVPGNLSGQSPQWTGTADKIHLETKSGYSTEVYTMPNSSIDNSHLEPVVEKLSKVLQRDGYFGYLCIDICCFPDKSEDKIVALIIETSPFYSHAEHFFDFMKFAINGTYTKSSNSFNAGVQLIDDMPRKFSTIMSTTKIANWNETTERYGIAIGQLYHPRFNCYNWKKFRTVIGSCGIKWNATTKQGAVLALHDGMTKKSAMLVVITSSMESTLKLTKHCLKMLYASFRSDTNSKNISNLLESIHLFNVLSKNDRNLSLDKCDPMNQVR